MKICLVGIEYPKETGFGGIATYQFLLANELKRQGHEVTVICGTNKKDYEYQENGIHVIRIHTNRIEETIDTFHLYRKKVKEILNRLIEDEQIEIVETPEFSGEIVEFLKGRKIPVVTRLHTSYTIWSQMNQSKLSKELHKEVLKSEELVLKYSDQIVSCSESLKELMPKYHNINTNHIIVSGNPANTNDFYPTKSNHNSSTIVFCGTIERRKGIYQFAKAIPIMIERLKDDNLRFQIIGNYAIVDQKGLDYKTHFLNILPKKYHKYIEFTGPIPNSKLNEYFNKARIGVIPSLFDNLPYVAMEELLTELPIVASSNTGIKEMIEDNVSGILYSPEDYKALADGVIRLYKNKELATSMGKRGRKEILRKFSPEVIAKKNIKIYEETIKKFQKEKSKMHVCLVNFEYPNETIIGGIATYQKRIAEALYENGCRVTVVCGSWDKPKDYYENGIHIIRVHKNFPYRNKRDYYSYRKEISDLIKEIDSFNKIDVIESPELSAEMITFMKEKTIPVVTKLHTSYTFIKKFNNETAMFPKEIEDIIYKNENYIINHSDAVVSCSEILKGLMPKYHKINNVNDIIVSGNPANTKDFYPNESHHNSNTILYCGKVIERKGVFVLAKAIPIIIDQLKEEDIHFQLVGDYECVEQQNVVAKDVFLNLVPKKYHKYIEFTGPIPNEKLNDYFNRARIGVIPSLFDNLPYVAMEELLTELPIVASSNTGIKEMIEDNVSGILYSPEDYKALADGVIRLYKNKELATSMGKRGRKEILRKFSPEVIAKKNIKIYEDAIKHFHEKKNIDSFCKKHNLTNVKRMSNGRANYVFKCTYKNKEVVVKFYHKLKTYNYDFIKDVLKQDIHCNRLLEFYQEEDYNVGIYSYIEGKIKKRFSQNDLKEVFDECDKIHKNPIPNKNVQTIHEKTNKYYHSLKQEKDSSIKYLIKQYESIQKLLEKTNAIIHGDLYYKNIIWNSHVNFVDFDECIVGPSEYEMACFLIKNCFENNEFDIQYAKKIINFYRYRGYSINRINNYYRYYILKVLLEKLYYGKLYSLNLEDAIQKKDYWKWWYNLLKNEKLEKELFEEASE